MNNEVGKTGTYITKKTKYFLFVMSIIVIVLISVMFCIKVIKESADERVELTENIAHVLSVGIPYEVFETYSQDKSFLSDSLYMEVKQNLESYASQNDEVRSISVYYVNENVLHEFIQAGSMPEPADYDTYKKVMEQSIEKQSDSSYIPEFSKIGKSSSYTSTIIKDSRSEKVIGMLIIEMTTHSLFTIMLERLLLTIFISVFILSVFIGIAIVQNKNRMLLDEKKRLTESVKALNVGEMLFRGIIQQAVIGISINSANKDFVLETDLLGVNKAYERITGYTKEQLMSKKWTDLTHEDFQEKEKELMQSLLKGEIKSYQIEKKIVRADGIIKWVNVIVSGLYLGSKANQKYLRIVEDIDARKKMELSLIENEKDKSILISNMPGMAFRTRKDMALVMEFVSSGCYELTGYPADRFTGDNSISYEQIIDNKYVDYVTSKRKQAIINKSKYSVEYEILTASKESKWVYEQGVGIYGPIGEMIYIEGLIIDIDKSKKKELELRYLNDHNPLTGLYSKSYFHDILNREVEDGIAGSKAAILINIRNFSLLNTIYGYEYSEEIIKELSTQLRIICLGKYQIFHISIDRFIIYIKAYEDKQALIGICNKISSMIYRRFITKIVGGNMGIYEFDCYMTDVDIIIRNASIAAENADSSRSFAYMFFDADMEKKIIRKSIIEKELTKISYSDEEDRLYVMFQPIISLQDGKIDGFEALARFNSESLGNIPPSEFIPIAEEKHLIVALGKKIMRLALAFIKQLESDGFDKIYVSVNISAIQLLRDEFVNDIIDRVYEYSIKPENLVLEITESVLAENYIEINEKLSLLQKEGFKIAIDDFGTGYSSLARESELNVNYIKIDKYFMDKLLVVDEEYAVTSEIISMSHKLGHYVVAEGVEHACQKEYLRKYGCDYFQGYLFSKPLSKKDAILLIKKNHL